jgi:putative acetyltransferase
MVESRGIAGRARYRAGTAADLDKISSIETQSYLHAGAGLSKSLVTGPEDTLSFVATLDAEIIGHALLTRIEGPQRALALAPPAILPQWRDMQIGTCLVRHALDQARRAGWRAVFVYGQPDYYRRFGFRSDLADCAQTDLQGPRLMALELVPEALAGWSGPLAFPDAYQVIVNAAHR